MTTLIRLILASLTPDAILTPHAQLTLWQAVEWGPLPVDARVVVEAVRRQACSR